MKLKKKKIFRAGILALLLLLVAGLMLHIIDIKGQLAASLSTNTALSTDMVKYRDKSGAEITEKALILSNYKALKAIHASDSSEIGRLQKLVKKSTISATIIRNQTTGTAAGTTSVTFVNNTDSLRNVTGPCDTIYPIYNYADSTKWADISVRATKDSTQVKYRFRNEYEITQENKKEGIWPFRRKTPVVMVRNLNPYTETTQISSYAVATPKNGAKTATLTGVAALIGIIAGIFIAK